MSYLFTVLIPLLGIMSFWLGIYYFFFYKQKSFCDIFITEMVGDAEVFRGIFKGVKKGTSTSEFLSCDKITHFNIDMPDSKDFMHSSNGNKIVFVCKYGERDFRVKKKFDSTYFKKVTKQVFDEFEDDNGDIIKKPVLNDEGNPIYEIVEEFYIEPRGVDQKGMDAIRTGLQNERELQKEKGENTFWNKYGQSVILIGSIMIIALLIMKSTGDAKEIFISNGESCKFLTGEIETIGKKVDNPSWANQVLQNIADGKFNEPPPK